MFKKYEIETKVLAPKKFRLKRIKTEIRVDPLTGKTSRITTNRAVGDKIEDENQTYIQRIKDTEKNCPLCYDNIEKVTPKFPKDICEDGRFTYKNSILFPNLFPYDRYSAVSTFSKSHFIEIGKFSTDDYVDTLINSRQYLRKVFSIENNIRFSAITQNYLPSSGGTLIHPHLQVNVFTTPTNYLDELLRNSRNYFIANSRCFWEDLIKTEEEIGERFICKKHGIIWLTPFAPRGRKEVWAIFEEASDFREIDTEEISLLSKGIVAVQKYYRDMGENSFNLGIYSISGSISSYRLLFRIVARANFSEFYRNDQSYFEVILGESATDEFPEDISFELKKYFE